MRSNTLDGNTSGHRLTRTYSILLLQSYDELPNYPTLPDKARISDLQDFHRDCTKRELDSVQSRPHGEYKSIVPCLHCRALDVRSEAFLKQLNWCLFGTLHSNNVVSKRRQSLYTYKQYAAVLESNPMAFTFQHTKSAAVNSVDPIYRQEE